MDKRWKRLAAKVEVMGRYVQPLLFVANRDFLVDLRDPVPLRVPRKWIEGAHAPCDFQLVGIVGVDRLIEPYLHLTAAYNRFAGIQTLRIAAAHIANVSIGRPQILGRCRGAQRAGHSRCTGRQHAPLHHCAPSQC